MLNSWKFFTLSWVYLNSSYFKSTNTGEKIGTLTDTDIRQSIQNALHIWSRDSNLNFNEDHYNNDSDIKIAFMRGKHGDSKAFDGKGDVLAHAFFPNDTRRGDIHLDLDEDWTKDKLTGVLAHEIGHSLGLKHDKDIHSIMFYTFLNNIIATSTDIKNIQEKYGTRKYYPINSIVVYDKNSNELRFKIAFKNFKQMLGLT